ncbi:MAG: sigma-54-dependent transcriptional regulator, partial [Candidatus Krumholzibacteriia bacterium]
MTRRVAEVASESSAPQTPGCRVLVVDDDTLSRDLAAQILSRAGHEVVTVEDGAAAMPRIRNGGFEVVVCDLMMPRVGGLQLLEWMRVRAPDTEMIMFTAHADVSTAVQAMRLGAFDYVTKPFQCDQLVLLVARAAERRRLVLETRELRQQLGAQRGVEALVGRSPQIERVRERILLAAESDVTVLVSGETGTGKELVARALHQASARRDKPFISVNCAALPEGLVASELFGHERGSFTSAVRSRAGRFEAADGGTLHL